MFEMKKRKINDLWRMIGCTIEIKDDETFEHIPAGMYTVYEKTEYGYGLYGNGISYLLEDWGDDATTEVEVYFMDPLMRTQSLIESINSQILELINEGWIDSDKDADKDTSMNLRQYFDKLKSLIILKNINVL